jgi:hypothetical protein
MIWLTWRQFRIQAIVTAAALAAFAIALAVTGPQLASLYSSSGLATCHAACATMAGNFISAVRGTTPELVFYLGIALTYAAPALIGLFWGAPLVCRELEAGTFRLAWNQSVTRTRWITVKLGLIGLAAMATAGLLSLMTSWWASPLYRAARQAGANVLSINRLAPPLFGATGIAPVGYAAFAFAVGVTAGVLTRRLLAAMAITLAVFAAVQLLTPAFVRPHLITPVSTTEALGTVSFNGIGDFNNGTIMLLPGSIAGHAGDWIVASHPVNTAGQAITKVPAACSSGGNGNGPSGFLNCLASNGVRLAVSYQPASRYWALQWDEAAIFLILAVGLGGACYWRVRRLS